MHNAHDDLAPVPVMCPHHPVTIQYTVAFFDTGHCALDVVYGIVNVRLPVADVLASLPN